MADRTNNSTNKNSAASIDQSKAAEPAKYEVPIDLDDILAIAIADSVVRVKRRRSRSRTAARRPRL
jgi:hypothetical protein